jgi:hypothetical protein
MSGKLFHIAAVTVALALPAGAFAGNKKGPASQFVTKGFVNLRQGPGTSFPLLTVIPPATPVNVDHCSASWSAGWCEASYGGQTGFVRGSLLEILPAGKPGTAKPKFLVQAEKNYHQAQSALRTAQENLDRLRQTEAQQSQAALAKTGSWIEPQALWQKMRAAEQNLAFAQERERQARAALDNAEDQARSIWEANWSRSHQPTRPSWWQWW